VQCFHVDGTTGALSVIGRGPTKTSALTIVDDATDNYDARDVLDRRCQDAETFRRTFRPTANVGARC